MKRSYVPVSIAFVCLCISVPLLKWLHDEFTVPYAGVGFWHGMIFYFSICLLIAAIWMVAGWISGFSHEKCLKSTAVFISFALFFLVAEVSLRLTGNNRAYIETRDNYYRSAYVSYDENVLWRCKPNTERYLVSDEFKYLRKYNNYGFSDNDFVDEKDTSGVLIQFYGDSFTEGDGAPADSSYPVQLKELLGGKKLQIQNYGICGNDPVFCVKQLQEIGMKFKPDYVVMTYTTGDLSVDLFVRKGTDRFKGNYWKGFVGPSWEWLYANSYLFRLGCSSLTRRDYNSFFLTPKECHRRMKELELEWCKNFKLLNELALKANVKVLLIKKPEHYELDENNYSYDMSFFEGELDSMPQIKVFDLLTYYRDSMEITGDNSGKYYWPRDTHHNSEGYTMMAKGVLAGLRANYPEILNTGLPNGEVPNHDRQKVQLK